MTTETMTITQLIAEKKKIESKIFSIIGNTRDFNLILFYSKNRPFIGARSVDEATTKISSDIQSLNDLVVRWNAINKARVKANAETMVEVDEFVSPVDAFSGVEPKKESISIAEAILRKKWFKDNLTTIAANLKHTYVANLSKKDKLEDAIETKINSEISQRFPQDANKNWSQDTLKKAKDELKQEYEVKRIDPYDIIAKDCVTKFCSYIESYISNIDTALSIVNAKTEVTFEY